MGDGKNQHKKAKSGEQRNYSGNEVLAIDICHDPFYGFAPGILRRIAALGDYYHLEMLDDVFSSRSRRRKISKTKFAKIVESIISDAIDEIGEEDIRKTNRKKA